MRTAKIRPLPTWQRRRKGRAANQLEMTGEEEKQGREEQCGKAEYPAGDISSQRDPEPGQKSTAQTEKDRHPDKPAGGGLFTERHGKSAWRPGHVPAGKDVKVKVMDTLSGLLANIGDYPIALQSQFSGQRSDDSKNMANRSLIALVYLRHRLDMLLGDNQKMSGCLGIDIIEGIAEVILVRLIRRDFPGDNFAEQTIAHKKQPPFSLFYRKYLLWARENWNFIVCQREAGYRPVTAFWYCD